MVKYIYFLFEEDSIHMLSLSCAFQADIFSKVLASLNLVVKFDLRSCATVGIGEACAWAYKLYAYDNISPFVIMLGVSLAFQLPNYMQLLEILPCPPNYLSPFS